ncbi:MAG: Stf0 family sulfotransferase [Cypionkella sp.]
MVSVSSRKGTLLARKFDKPAVLFCATQRSGSTMVTDDFQNLTGRSSTETEGFYHLVLAPKAPGMTWDKAMGILEAHRRDEAVFFDRVMFHYLVQLSQMIDQGRHDPMCTPFAEYFAGATWVHIQRADVFQQVVSKYLADALNVWVSTDAKSREFNAGVEFDLDKARMYLRALLREDRQWHSFFAKHGIKPVQIYYEDAVSNFPGYMTPLLSRLGLKADLSAPPRPRMEKLGNARNLVLAEVLRDMTLRDLATNTFEMRDFFRNRFV